MKKKLILLFLPFLCALADQEYRNWTNNEGKSIEARFIKFTKDKFEIRRKDGRSFTMTSDMLSEEDQKFLEELRKRADSRGYIWDASSASYELKRQKWFDSEKDDRSVNFYEFKSEKIDINEDQKSDGNRVRIFQKLNKYKYKPKAWEVDDYGYLYLRSANSNTTYEGKYKYDFEKESFIKIDGYGPAFFISAEK
jgi:hypothetical protein